MADSIGSLIDSLGVTPVLGEDELVSDAIVLLKVVEADGAVRLSASWSDGMSWIERVGMLHAARVGEDAGQRNDGCEHNHP